LRRALYVDPSFAPAAFQLARAHDRRGDTEAARKAYAWTLRTLDQNRQSPDRAIDQADLAEIALACRARLGEAAGRR
jgi:Tfp pilus assembly protein PilF